MTVPAHLRPPMGASDLYVYLHSDGVLTAVDADGRSRQCTLADLRATVVATQADGGTVWISGPDSELGLGALSELLGDEPDATLIDVWAAPAPPVQWGADGGGSGFLAAAEFGQRDLLVDLLDRGADVAAADRGGNTALHFAVHGGNVDGVAALLAAGADASARNGDGITPLGLALMRRKRDAAALLAAAAPQNVSFAISHRLLRIVGPPVLVVCGAIAVVLAAAGNPLGAASVAAVATVLAFVRRRWSPSPHTAEIVRMTDGGVEVLRGWRRREEIDLTAVDAAVFVGRAGPQSRLAIPHDAGGPWSDRLARRLALSASDRSTVTSWDRDVVLLTFDWVLRHEALPVLATRLVAEGAELSESAWERVGEAVIREGAKAPRP